MYKFTLFFFIFITSCNSQVKDEVELNINFSVENNIKSKEDYKLIIKSLKGFLKTKDSIFRNNPYWIEDDNKFFQIPFSDLINIQKFGNSISKPTLLSITPTEVEDVFEIKIGWFFVKDEKISLQSIYSLLAVKKNGQFFLKNILEKNSNIWKKYRVGNIKFYSNPSHNFDENKAVDFNSINKEIAVFFEEKEIRFTYFICKSNKELMQITGFDFESSMFYSNQNGSLTYPYDKIIFSGNDNEQNIHELVHLYTFQKFKNKHNLIDEGLATYLGGSKGLSYKEHLFKLKNHLLDTKIDLYEELFFNNYVLDDTTSLRYTLGAFLCDLAIQKGKKEKLFELLSSGKDNKSLIETIKLVFGIDNDDFNQFIQNELNKYDFQLEIKAF